MKKKIRLKDKLSVVSYEKENMVLWKAIDDIMWMAIRYAHGRHTYAPSMVRDAVMSLRKIKFNWKLKNDSHIVQVPTHKLKGFDFRSDYLDDLFIDNGGVK